MPTDRIGSSFAPARRSFDHLSLPRMHADALPLSDSEVSVDSDEEGKSYHANMLASRRGYKIEKKSEKIYIYVSQMPLTCKTISTYFH